MKMCKSCKFNQTISFQFVNFQFFKFLLWPSWYTATLTFQLIGIFKNITINTVTDKKQAYNMLKSFCSWTNWGFAYFSLTISNEAFLELATYNVEDVSSLEINYLFRRLKIKEKKWHYLSFPNLLVVERMQRILVIYKQILKCENWISQSNISESTYNQS